MTKQRYVIGVMFTPDFEKTLLLNKQKPAWQKDHLNFPGGKIEDGEFSVDAIVREFKEETNLNTVHHDWNYIGQIRGEGYQVYIHTAMYENIMGQPVSMTSEVVDWYDMSNLPKNVISNIPWLSQFALNYHKQGLNGQDKLTHGIFNYTL